MARNQTLPLTLRNEFGHREINVNMIEETQRRRQDRIAALFGLKLKRESLLISNILKCRGIQ